MAPKASKWPRLPCGYKFGGDRRIEVMVSGPGSGLVDDGVDPFQLVGSSSGSGIVINPSSSLSISTVRVAYRITRKIHIIDLYICGYYTINILNETRNLISIFI